MKYRPKHKILKNTKMAEKHSKTCSTSLVIMKVQIKATLKFPHAPVRMDNNNSNNNKDFILARMWGKENTHPLLVRVKT